MFASHGSRLESASPVARSAVFDAARKRCVWLLALPAICLLLPKTASAQCYYTYESIPKPPGWLANPANSLNNLGQVAGTLVGAGDNERVYTWSAETGTVMLPLPPGIISMESAYMNDAGVVAGAMTGAAPNYRHSMYLKTGATYTTIPLPSWANTVFVRGITNEGRVYGTINNNGTGPSHPFIWFNGQWNDVGSLVAGYISEGEGLSATGRLVGTAYTVVNGASFTRAFELSGANSALLPPGELRGGASDCNNNGLTTGWVSATVAANSSGAIWRGTASPIVTPPPTGVSGLGWSAINDAGRAVGGYGYETRRGIVWQAGQVSVLKDLVLPPITWRISNAYAINQSGQVIAETDQGSILLTPHWLPGDLTGDCHVTLDDLVLVLMNFGMPVGSYSMGDADLDGSVDLTDLAVVLIHWGE